MRKKDRVKIYEADFTIFLCMKLSCWDPSLMEAALKKLSLPAVCMYVCAHVQLCACAHFVPLIFMWQFLL